MLLLDKTSWMTVGHIAFGVFLCPGVIPALPELLLRTVIDIGPGAKAQAFAVVAHAFLIGFGSGIATVRVAVLCKVIRVYRASQGEQQRGGDEYFHGVSILGCGG